MGAAAVAAKLVVQVDMDTKGASSGASKFGKGLSKVTGPALAAGAAVAGIAVKAGASASRLQQAMGAVDSVFGDSAGQIKAWADQADQSVGLAASEYGELASVLGAQLKNMGVPMDAIAGKTNDLIKMGADLSATYGGTTADAVAALGSALRGETDPIEKYGISIKQATIEAAVGKKKLKGMTDSQAKAAKTTALLGLVTKQAGGAVGAFGREADTASGQQQRATAAWEDASAELGTALLPAMTAVSKALAAMAGWVSRNQTLVTAIVAVIGTLAAVILVLAGAVKLYNLYTAISAAVTKAAWLSALGPIALVIAAVVAVVAIIVVLYKKVAWFRKFVDATWRVVAAGARAAFNGVKVIVNAVFTALRIYLTAWFKLYSAIFRAVLALARVIWTGLKNVVRVAIDGVRAIISTILDKVRSVLTSAKTVWDSIWAKLPGPVKTAMRLATAPIDAMGTAISKVVGWVDSLINKIRNIKFPSPPGWMSKIPGVGRTAPGGSTAAVGVSGVSGAAVRGPATVTGGGGVTVIVQGALDPVAVAAQINRLLGADVRRRGAGMTAGRRGDVAGAV